MAEQAQAQFSASVGRIPLTVASLLIGLGLLAALLAGLEINQPPIGAVDGGVPVAQYLPADGPRSADKFLLVLFPRVAPPGLFCADDRLAMEGWAADPAVRHQSRAQSVGH
jgi:hypothetical protein